VRKFRVEMDSAQILLAGGGGAAVAGAFAWAAVAPSSQIFGSTVRHTGDASAVALTFDDGPNPAATPPVLDLLARYDAHATFFQIGGRVRAFPVLAKEVARQGHSLGNHTETHPRLTFASPGRIRHELTRCDEALAAAAGQAIHWVRPPYGYRGPQLDPAIRAWNPNARVVMWSRSARDWKASSPERIIRRLHGVRGGDIVLLHDGDHRTPEGDRRHTVAALAYWLPRWKDAGMRFVSMDEAAQAASAAG
jgi:peptidoglycan/xylan/chitin deacetylase (PgdA/CDA1 family)